MISIMMMLGCCEWTVASYSGTGLLVSMECHMYWFIGAHVVWLQDGRLVLLTGSNAALVDRRTYEFVWFG